MHYDEQREKELAIAERYSRIAVDHREYMLQPIEDLAEYHPDISNALYDLAPHIGAVHDAKEISDKCESDLY